MKKRSRDEITECAVCPHIEIIGNSKCLVEGLKGISEYTKDRIKFDMGKFSVSFIGDGLYIDSFTVGGASVEGIIFSLEFEGNA